MNDRIESITRNLELYKALLAAKVELPVIEKRKTARIQTSSGPGYSYSYADLADVDTQATPVLAEHGLMIDFEMHKAEDGTPILTGMLIHPESGGFKTSEWDVTGRTPQDQGGSITYGRRYLTGILTGIITDEDTDGRQAQPGGRPAAKPKAKAADAASTEQVARLMELAHAGFQVKDIMQQLIGSVPRPEDLTADQARDVLQAIEAA